MSSLLENTWLASRRVSVLGRITLPGDPLGFRNSQAVFSADGSRAFILTTPYGIPIAPARMAVFNLATGRQVGRTLTLNSFVGTPVVGADGSHVFILGSDGSNTRVTVLNTRTALTSTTFALPGAPTSAESNTDGSRVVVTTTTTVALFNSATGAQIGTNSAFTEATLSADGSRVLLTRGVTDPTTNAVNTQLAVLNTTTGAQIGTTLTLDGAQRDVPVFSADGTRALVTTTVDDPATAATTIAAAMINMTTGAQTGTPFALPAEPSKPLLIELNANGSRALLTTPGYISSAGGWTDSQVSVIDTATGAQLGTTLTFPGDHEAMLSVDRTRVVTVTATSDSATGADTTQVTAVNLATGAQTITTLDGLWSIPLRGPDYGTALSSTDGSRVLLTRGITNPTTNRTTTQLVVINTSTSAQIGATLTLPGQEFGSLPVSADGSRALIVTTVYDGDTGAQGTRLAVIDTTTGRDISTPIILTGYLNGPVKFSGDRTVVATICSNSNECPGGKPTTQAAVINTITGTQVGSTLTLNDAHGEAVLSADGTRAVVVNYSQLAVIDATTGTQMKPTIRGTGGAQFTADGSRAVIITPIYNLFTNSYTTRVTVVKTSG